MSHALTLLFRALPDEDATTVRQLAIAVRDALGGASPQRLEAILVGRWGVVPVFPWTNDPEIRGAVKKLRTMMRLQAQRGRDSVEAARPTPFEALSDSLISLLRALTDHEDAVVRQQAFETRTTFLGLAAS